jgi:hypothetical protein
MFTRAILTVALMLPLAAHAEDMFKWRDARGRIHYSNDTEKVPAGSEIVTKQLGHIGGEPVGEAFTAPAAPAGQPGPRIVTPRWQPETSCIRSLGLMAMPNQVVDFDRRYFFDLDQVCGKVHDIEGWLRDASESLELRKIGL